MSAQPGDAPTARTLFRSPAKPAAGAAAVTPPAAARDLRAKALSTRQAVDLSSKSGLRRALGEILLDVERAGGAGLDAAGFGAARTVLDIVCKAAAENEYSPDQRDEVSRALVILLDGPDDVDGAERVFEAPATPPVPRDAVAPVPAQPVQLALPQGLLGAIVRDKDADKDKEEEKDTRPGAPIHVPQPPPVPAIYGVNDAAPRAGSPPAVTRRTATQADDQLCHPSHLLLGVGAGSRRIADDPERGSYVS